MRFSKLVLALLFLATLTGCSSKMLPLKGRYLDPPFQIKTTKSFQQIWDNLIDLFAQKGLPIRIIDKNSGLITSDRAKLSSTTEKKDGTLLDPEAFIVVPQIYNPGPRKYYPISRGSDITGEWNVRVKETNGETIINVNIVNVKYMAYDAYYKIPKEYSLTTYKSTGVFEKLISEIINK
jgi:hypothetical protein